jgi:hypothetical protein
MMHGTESNIAAVTVRNDELGGLRIFSVFGG